MESGQDQADGLQTRKDDLINFSIPVDYQIDCSRNQREGLQANDSLELLHSGTMDTQYSLCTKNIAEDLETNTGSTVPHTDKVHLDDAISSTTVTVSYVNRPHLFSSQRILQHSLHEQPLASLFIPSVCVQSQQMVPVSLDSSIPTNFVDSSFESSVLTQSDDLEPVGRGLENGIDCNIINQHKLKVLDLDLPLATSAVHEPGSCDSPLEQTLDTAEETLYEQSSVSSELESQDPVCQFSGEIHQENEWHSVVSPAETDVQDSEMIVIELTQPSMSEDRPNKKEHCENRNLLDRVEHCETQNGTNVFTDVENLNNQYTEVEPQPVCDLSRACKDQTKVENVNECSEVAVPDESEETSDKTCPIDLTEGERNVSTVCDTSALASNSMKMSPSIVRLDDCQRAYVQSVRTNMSYYEEAPNVYDVLQNSEEIVLSTSDSTDLHHFQQTNILSEQHVTTGEWSPDQEVVFASDLKNGKMHRSENNAESSQTNNLMESNCNSPDSMISPSSGDLTPNLKVPEQSLSSDDSCMEVENQISISDSNGTLSATKLNLKESPESEQVVNNVCEDSRSSTSFTEQMFPSLQRPSVSEGNHPRIKPCSLELHKLNVLETEGKCDVRGYVLDLKKNNVASMACSISMSLSLAKSGKIVEDSEQGDFAENSEKSGQSSSTDNVCEFLSVQEEPQIFNRRKQTLVAKPDDSDVVCISEEEEDESGSVTKTDMHQDQVQAHENKKWRTASQQHANQKKLADQPLQSGDSAEPKHFERKILPPRQRGMRLEQIVQNIVTQPKSRTSSLSERLRRSRDARTPTRFQPPRYKSCSSTTEQKSKGSAGYSPCIRESVQKTTLEYKIQEQNEANQGETSTIPMEKQNKNKSTSIPGSCQGHATKLSAPISPTTSLCSASSASQQLTEISRKGHPSGNKQEFGKDDLKCLNRRRRKQLESTKNALQPKNCVSSRQRSTRQRTRGTARKRIRKPVGKKRQTRRGQPSSFFAPEEPEIKLRALSLKVEDRRDRYDSFSPYIRVETKGYSTCTVVNYAEEDSNSLKQKKHSQQQSHGAVPKSSCLTLGPTINEACHKSFLVCCLCGQSANAMEQGDLFGPFYPRGYAPSNSQTARSKDTKTEQASTVVSSPSCNSIRSTVNKTSGQNQESRTREGATTRGQKRRGLDSEEITKCSDSKKPKNELSLEEWYQPPLVPMDSNEYWMHEDCVTWCAGVFLVRGKLYGLLEAINVAQETDKLKTDVMSPVTLAKVTESRRQCKNESINVFPESECYDCILDRQLGPVHELDACSRMQIALQHYNYICWCNVEVQEHLLCSMCEKTGATLGCYIKGCPLKYHYACAVDSKCFLNEDNFSMKCAKHKDKALKVSAKGESR